jgi:hypothetical protein
MPCLRPRRLGCAVALALTLCAHAARADQFQYHYVPLRQAAVPAGFRIFRAEGIDNGGRVYGNVIDDSANPQTHLAVWTQGVITVLQPDLPSWGSTVNSGGTVGGYVVTDVVNFFTQAALFHGTEVELVPRRPGEVASDLLALNDSGTAFVVSYDENFDATPELYKNGRLTTIDFGPLVPFSFYHAENAQGIISGTTFGSTGYVGFRFDPHTSMTTLLEPIDGDPHAWALGINNRGHILGYSFIFGSTERIGVWDATGVFTPYFVEGTLPGSTVSNFLYINNNDLIVITQTTDGTSYIVPRPGVRLDLEDLVDDLPAGVPNPLYHVRGLNDPGDMFGSDGSGAHAFVLQRGGHGP